MSWERVKYNNSFLRVKEELNKIIRAEKEDTFYVVPCWRSTEGITSLFRAHGTAVINSSVISAASLIFASTAGWANNALAHSTAPLCTAECWGVALFLFCLLTGIFLTVSSSLAHSVWVCEDAMCSGGALWWLCASTLISSRASKTGTHSFHHSAQQHGEEWIHIGLVELTWVRLLLRRYVSVWISPWILLCEWKLLLRQYHSHLQIAFSCAIWERILQQSNNTLTLSFVFRIFWIRTCFHEEFSYVWWCSSLFILHMQINIRGTQQCFQIANCTAFYCTIQWSKAIFVSSINSYFCMR